MKHVKEFETWAVSEHLDCTKSEKTETGCPNTTLGQYRYRATQVAFSAWVAARTPSLTERREADILTLQEVWNAAGGSQEMTPSKEDVLEALNSLPTVLTATRIHALEEARLLCKIISRGDWDFDTAQNCANGMEALKANKVSSANVRDTFEAYQELVALKKQLESAPQRLIESFDTAVAVELPKVSTLTYNSQEICKEFAKRLRLTLAASPDGTPVPGVSLNACRSPVTEPEKQALWTARQHNNWGAMEFYFQGIEDAEAHHGFAAVLSN